MQGIPLACFAAIRVIHLFSKATRARMSAKPDALSRPTACSSQPIPMVGARLPPDVWKNALQGTSVLSHLWKFSLWTVARHIHRMQTVLEAGSRNSENRLGQARQPTLIKQKWNLRCSLKTIEQNLWRDLKAFAQQELQFPRYARTFLTSAEHCMFSSSVKVKHSKNILCACAYKRLCFCVQSWVFMPWATHGFWWGSSTWCGEHREQGRAPVKGKRKRIKVEGITRERQNMNQEWEEQRSGGVAVDLWRALMTTSRNSSKVPYILKNATGYFDLVQEREKLPT